MSVSRVSSTAVCLLCLLSTISITVHVTADDAKCCATIGTPNCDKDINARLTRLLATRATRCMGNKWGENLALRKNATQSSTHEMGRASYAVDGNTNSDFGGQSCMHTIETANEQAWWAVDLGQETTIGHVRITNRNVASERLRNFYVGLTNVSPWTCPPLLNQSSICKFYYGNFPANGPTAIYCDSNFAAGRYLFVQLTAYASTENDPLHICELEAYC